MAEKNREWTAKGPRTSMLRPEFVAFDDPSAPTRAGDPAMPWVRIDYAASLPNRKHIEAGLPGVRVLGRRSLLLLAHALGRRDLRSRGLGRGAGSSACRDEACGWPSAWSTASACGPRSRAAARCTTTTTTGLHPRPGREPGRSQGQPEGVRARDLGRRGVRAPVVAAVSDIVSNGRSKRCPTPTPVTNPKVKSSLSDALPANFYPRKVGTPMQGQDARGSARRSRPAAARRGA